MTSTNAKSFIANRLREMIGNPGIVDIISDYVFEISFNGYRCFFEAVADCFSANVHDSLDVASLIFEYVNGPHAHDAKCDTDPILTDYGLISLTPNMKIFTNFHPLRFDDIRLVSTVNTPGNLIIVGNFFSFGFLKNGVIRTMGNTMMQPFMFLPEIQGVSFKSLTATKFSLVAITTTNLIFVWSFGRFDVDLKLFNQLRIEESSNDVRESLAELKSMMLANDSSGLGIVQGGSMLNFYSQAMLAANTPDGYYANLDNYDEYDEKPTACVNRKLYDETIYRRVFEQTATVEEDEDMDERYDEEDEEDEDMDEENDEMDEGNDDMDEGNDEDKGVNEGLDDIVD